MSMNYSLFVLNGVYKVDTMKISYCMFLVLLCCQYGVSYRIYILPEPGTFCLGVFSGDDCITWSEYTTNPLFFDHSITLIFTPGNYTLQGRYSDGRFSVANINTFIMMGSYFRGLEFVILRMRRFRDVR